VRFLRHSKYSPVRATEELKIYLSCPKRYPECFQSFSVREPIFFEIMNSNVVLLMPDVDADGCRICIYRSGCLNTEKVTFVDLQRLLFIASEIASNMEEVQIAGMKIIVDYSDISVEFLKWLTLKDYKTLGEMIQSPFWFRFKACYILNLPSFAVHIFNFVLKFASEKMKGRFKFLKDKNELKDHMDVNQLVEDYDGKITVEQSRNYVNEMLDKWEDAVSLVGQIDAEFENIESGREAGGSSEFEFGAMGSFKKLEID
jgi:hypothetical protein